MLIHAVNFGREQRRLVPARARADFHDHILVIVRVLREQQNLKLRLKLLHALSGLAEFLLRELPHLLVGFLLKHRKRVLDALSALLIFLVRLDNRCQVTLFLHQPAEALRIVRHIRLAQFVHQFLKTDQQIL